MDRWIDLPGDGGDRSRADAYQSLGGGDLQSLTYARIYCPPTPHPKYSAAIQYWFFYYDNPWYLNRHEGDWEMVQVMLDHDQNPIAMGFSTHFTGVKRPWATINKQNSHPLVYVAKGGHGSYSFPARYSASDPTQLAAWWTVGVDDATTAMTPGTPIAVQMIPERPDRQSWLYFNGHWGSSEDILNDAPLGPRGRIAKHLDGDPSLWDNPIVWFNQLETYEDSRATTHGKIQVSTPDAINITISLQGGANRSTLNRAANALDEAIESYVNPETGRRVVIVHQPDTGKLYDVTLNALGTTQPSAQVRLHFPDVNQGAMVAVTYPLPSAWGQNSKATVTVNQTNDLQLQVDLDGNGVTDQSIAPSSIQTESVPSIAQITLAAGWNLVALPLSPANTTPTAVFTTIAGKYDLVYAYNGCATSNPWQKYNPSGPPFANTLTTVTGAQGLWVRTTSTATLSLAGFDLANTSIPLCVGWNLISYPGNAPTPIATALSGIAGKYDLVYAYDAGSPANPWKKYNPTGPPFANTLTEVKPGMGYWLRATQATMLVVE